MNSFKRHPLEKFTILAAVSIMLVLIVGVSTASAETTLKTKGGVIYPHTGDSTQTFFRLPKAARDVLRPGDVLGVLPTNCLNAAGPEGPYYICHYGIFLQPAFKGDRVVYVVLKIE